MRRVHTATATLAIVALGAGVFAARGLVRRPSVERSLPPSPAAPEHVRPPVSDPDFSPATPEEARAALARAFDDRLAMTQEAAAVGDFNGDGAPDLAVAVRARPGAEPALLDPLANWTMEDCVTAMHPAADVARHHDAAPLAQGEALLAVLHGYGARGWRDPEARQAYLVRGAVAGPWSRRPLRDFVPEAPDDRLRRDVLAGPPGTGNGRLVYWIGGRYACTAAPAPARPVASGH
jgi:hypothetical protein